MAATTSMILGGAGALMGGVQALSGNKTRKEGQEGLNDYERGLLSNAFDKIPINTACSDISN